MKARFVRMSTKCGTVEFLQVLFLERMGRRANFVETCELEFN